MASKFRIWMLTEAAFIAGTLLAPGSRITSQDLGTFKDADGKDQPVRPPSTAIEVDANGELVDDADGAAFDRMLGAAPTDPDLISRVGIGSGGIGAPAQAPGGVHLAANQLAQPTAITAKRRSGGDASGAGNASAEAAALAAMDADKKADDGKASADAKA